MRRTFETGNGVPRNRGSPRLRPKRKFPGPAGILPDLDTSDVMGLNVLQNRVSEQVAEIISSDTKSRKLSLSQSPATQIEKDQGLLGKLPWTELMETLGLSTGDENCPTKHMNIDWIVRMGCQLPIGTKVPFLAAVLMEAPELPGNKPGQEKPSRIKLLDPTGKIEAAIDPAFVKRHSKDLLPGTALAVTNAGILHFKRRIVLTITSKNVLCLASTLPDDPVEQINEEDDEESSSQPAIITHPFYLTENQVKITQFSNFLRDRILESFKRISEPVTRRPDHTQTTRSTVLTSPSKSLFSTVSSVFDDEDDDLFLHFDMDAADEVSGTKSTPSTQPREDVSSERLIQTETARPLVNCNVEAADSEDFIDDFEDEFDRELATFDETTVEEACSQLQNHNDSSESRNHFEILQEDQIAKSLRNSVATNSLQEFQRSSPKPKDAPHQEESTGRAEMCDDIFESSQLPSEDTQSQSGSHSENRPGNQQVCIGDEGNDDEQFYDDFDQELDMLDS